MATHRYKVVGSMALAVAAACMVATANVAVAAEPSQAAPASAQKQEQALPLLEAATADGKGSFYTLDEKEFAKATAPADQGGNGFTAKNDSTAAGITMFKDEVPGSIPIHRLRQLDGHQGYILSKEDEYKQLGSSGKFEDEGTVGFLYPDQRPGTVALERFSKDGDWRVGRQSGALLGRIDLTLQGFGQDGVLGYFVPSNS
jgi:hypothetical protein